jgi:hypothetical protein
MIARPGENEDGRMVGSPAVKKPYKAPELIQWGTLRDITRTVGKSGNSDGGSGNTQKSSV